MKFLLNKYNKIIEVDFSLLDPDYPTVIFLHDSLGCIDMWKDIPNQLTEQIACNTLIYDRLGHGRSTAVENMALRGHDYHEQEVDVLLELVEALEIKRPFIYGNSDGGTIALLAAARRPDLFSGVITEGAHVFNESITRDGIRQAEIAYQDARFREKLHKYHGEKIDELVSAWISIWLHKEFKDWDITEQLKSIVCPVLVLQGTLDQYGTLKQVEAICTGVSGSGQSLILDNVGHTPHREAFNQIKEPCRDFIRACLA